MPVEGWSEWLDIGSIEVEAFYPEGWTEQDRYLRYQPPSTWENQKVTVWLPPTIVGKTTNLKLDLKWKS